MHNECMASKRVVDRAAPNSSATEWVIRRENDSSLRYRTQEEAVNAAKRTRPS